MHAWAQAGAGLQELASLSRAFLLREKTFLCAEIGQFSTEKSMALTRALDRVARDKIDWWLDDPTFTSYRDYDADSSP